MTDNDILQLAEQYGHRASKIANQFTDDQLITFANAIRNAALEDAAGISEDWDSDSADPRELAAAIRRMSDETR